MHTFIIVFVIIIFARAYNSYKYGYNILIEYDDSYSDGDECSLIVDEYGELQEIEQYF